MLYNKENPLRCFFGFAGYDSQALAFEMLKEVYPDFDYRIVGWSEIDKYAIQAHNALFPGAKDLNFGDISQIDWNKVPDFDFMTYSSPCQDFSNAGLQRGGEEGSGTRSSLLWEVRKAVIAKRPKYLMMENVKALVSEKFKPLFRKWEQELASYGYDNYCKVLNAKDYGIPQNRERIFCISILNDGQTFSFPEPFELQLRLKDMLEEKVDEKYYLDDEKVAKFVEHCDKKQAEGCGFKFEPSNGGGASQDSDEPCRDERNRQLPDV